MTNLATKVVLVGGTNANNNVAWWKSGSPFSDYLRDNGINQFRDFIWSTDLDGVPGVFSWFKPDQTDWLAGGAALTYLLEQYPLADRNIISHSHGRQVVLFATGIFNLKINRWVDISGPIRHDLTEITSHSTENIESSIHLYTTWDWVRILGSLFDGHVGLSATCPISKNIDIPHSFGHSKLLYDSQLFPALNEFGLIRFLKGDDR